MFGTNDPKFVKRLDQDLKKVLTLTKGKYFPIDYEKLSDDELKSLVKKLLKPFEDSKHINLLSLHHVLGIWQYMLKIEKFYYLLIDDGFVPLISRILMDHRGEMGLWSALPFLFYDIAHTPCGIRAILKLPEFIHDVVSIMFKPGGEHAFLCGVVLGHAGYDLECLNYLKKHKDWSTKAFLRCMWWYCVNPPPFQENSLLLIIRNCLMFQYLPDFEKYNKWTEMCKTLAGISLQMEKYIEIANPPTITVEFRGYLEFVSEVVRISPQPTENVWSDSMGRIFSKYLPRWKHVKEPGTDTAYSLLEFLG